MNDWRKKCEHGRYDGHWIRDDSPRPGIQTQEVRYLKDSCPGGSPVTAADLEGEKVVWCEEHDESKAYCELDDADGMYPPSPFHKFVERFLIPIPDPQPATEGT